jgi:hypothetical protein
MKAERRHDLKTNALARGLDSAPEFARRYGGRILLAVVLLVLLVILLNNYRKSADQAQTQVAAALANARNATVLLENLPPQGANPKQFLMLRDQYAAQAADNVSKVLETADDPKIRAEALISRGNLNWALANLPDLPGAETQPALRYARSREELLEEAEQAYRDALEFKDQAPHAGITARLSLAAVAENRRQWDRANEYYQSLIDDPAVAEAFKEEALERQLMLGDLRKPVLLAEPSTRKSAASEADEADAGPLEPEGPPVPETGESATKESAKEEAAPAEAVKERPADGAEKPGDAPREKPATEKPGEGEKKVPEPAAEPKKDDASAQDPGAPKDAGEPKLPDLSE